MPSLVNPTPEQLYDLLLLGLRWRRQKGPVKLPCRAVSIFGGLQCAGVISEATRASVARNIPLLNAVTLNMARIGTRRWQAALVGALDSLDKPLAVVADPTQALNYTMLLGPQGYRMALTDAGMRTAERHEETYGVTPESFYDGVERYGRQMANARSRREGEWD